MKFTWRSVPGLASLFLPKKILVIAGVIVETAALDLKNARREFVDEVAVVRNENDRSAELLQRFKQHILGLQVEVIGGFIEQQEIRRLQQHARHRVAVTFAAGKHADALEHIVIRKKKAAEQCAQTRLIADRRGRDAGEVVDQAGRRIERFVLVLREIIHFHIVSQAKFALRHGFGPGQQLDESGFSGAIHAHERDTVSTIDHKIDALKYLLLSVGLGDVAKRVHQSSTGRRFRK